MSDIKVTQAEIDLLLNSADVQVRTEFGKCTVVTVRLRNGFILTESSACVDPANYDVELGKEAVLPAHREPAVGAGGLCPAEEDGRGARCEVRGGGSENARLWLGTEQAALRLAGSAQRLERQGHFHQAAGAG